MSKVHVAATVTVAVCLLLGGCCQCCEDCVPKSSRPSDDPYVGYWVGERGTTMSLEADGRASTSVRTADGKEVGASQVEINGSTMRIYLLCGVAEQTFSVDKRPRIGKKGRMCMTLSGERMVIGEKLDSDGYKVLGKWSSSIGTLTVRADGWASWEPKSGKGGLAGAAKVSVRGDRVDLKILTCLGGIELHIDLKSASEFVMKGHAFRMVQAFATDTVHDLYSGGDDFDWD